MGRLGLFVSCDNPNLRLTKWFDTAPAWIALDCAGKMWRWFRQDGWIKTLFQPVLNEINLGRTCHLPSNPLTAPSLHIFFFYYRFFLCAMFMYFWILSEWINMRPQCCCGSGRCSHLSQYKHSSMVLKLKIYVELIDYFYQPKNDSLHAYCYQNHNHPLQIDFQPINFV